jgi:hypothetical protein
VIEQHHGVLGELELLADDGLAVLWVNAAAGWIQTEPVLGGGVEGVAIVARPAVPVAHVDDERCAVDGLLHRGPGRVRRVELHDVRRVLAGDRGGGSGLGAIAGVAAPDGRR